MYPGIKFQLTWRTSDFGTKFAPKNMSENKIKKINIEFETRIKQFMSLGLNISKKNTIIPFFQMFSVVFLFCF